MTRYCFECVRSDLDSYNEKVLGVETWQDSQELFYFIAPTAAIAT